MLLELVLVALVAASGGFGAAKLFARRPTLMLDEPPRSPRRFCVVMGTNSGAEARRLYEKLLPRGDGIVAFYERDTLRGSKEA